MEVFNCRLETVAFDKPHCVERPPIRPLTEGIYRNDSGMLQPSGDLRFHDESLAGDDIIGVVWLDLLQRHFAVQFLVESHGDLAQTPFRVRSQNPESPV